MTDTYCANSEDTMTAYAPVYTEQIMHRGRVMMEPADFVPDWLDKPRKQKFYPDAVRVPMPRAAGGADASGTTAAAFTANDGEQLGDDLSDLAEMLLHSYGLIGRRLGIQANTDLGGLPRYVDAGWSRGTASGGGLYPITIYYVAGADSQLASGIYHYSPMHHAFQRLLTGDVTAQIRGALATHQEREAGGGYFVLGLKYWQNAFKYNSFSFHAVTMDLGTVLATWTMWARARGRRLSADLWFDEAEVADLLGVDNDEEAIYAVVPLTAMSAQSRPAHGSSLEQAATGAPSHPAQVRIADEEQSRISYGFDAVERMQRESSRAARLSDEARTALERVGRPRLRQGPSLDLPSPAPLQGSLVKALTGRRSSFGRFVGAPMSAADLHTLLRAAGEGGLVTDAGADPSASASIYVFVNHVESIAKGAYQFDARTGSLIRLVDGDQGRFLQDNYFLSNNNLEQAGAVIVPAIPTLHVLDGSGARGYRLVNATIGAISQHTYVAASALGTGCGVALGFDNISFIERLELQESGEKPLLIMAVGNELPGSGNYRAEMV